MTRSHLKIYRGLPRSGKTTLAEGEASSYEDRLVGRDHIRKFIGVKGFVGSVEQEREVTELQERMILKGLRNGQVVHVDDMNLRDKYVKRLIGLAEYAEVPFQVVDLTHIDPYVCISRDANRFRSVGKSFIIDQYNRFIKGRGHPLPVPEGLLERVTPEPYLARQGSVPAFLIDIDGTVALHEGVRRHHDYHLVSQDLPNQAVIDVVRSSIGSGGLYPLFVSGRPDSCREATKHWIHKHVSVGSYTLLMRKTGDHRPDWMVKLEIFNNKIRDLYDVKYALDDRNQVVEMYRDMGLTVLQVAKGNF